MELLTVLGLDTGFDSDNIVVDDIAIAGLEWKKVDAGAPYIIKRPHFCDDLDELVQSGQVVVDHAIVPIRDLYQAAESRRAVVRLAGKGAVPTEIPGGLVGTDDPHKQEDVLATKFHHLLFAIAKHNIPLTLLHFPRGSIPNIL